ncbi:MAG TPA: hypothetical protein VEF76_02140 [Patescibacteria group bacterium]|nr:hypothetical protein [Patescibacteria group bacterium]
MKRTTTVEPDKIAGWAIDADPENRPAYPMRDYDEDDKGGMNWTRPTLQRRTVEILHSTERPNLSAVYGTAVPPSGLSGVLRRIAFRRSEGQWSHWLILLMADRINVIEGIFQDLFRGHVPNIWAEMGMRSELKYNRKAFMRKAAITTVVGVAVIAAIVAATRD